MKFCSKLLDSVFTGFGFQKVYDFLVKKVYLYLSGVESEIILSSYQQGNKFDVGKLVLHTFVLKGGNGKGQFSLNGWYNVFCMEKKYETNPFLTLTVLDEIKTGTLLFMICRIWQMLGNLKATWNKPDNYELFPTVSCAYFGLIPTWLLALYQELEWYQKQK